MGGTCTGTANCVFPMIQGLLRDRDVHKQRERRRLREPDYVLRNTGNFNIMGTVCHRTCITINGWGVSFQLRRPHADGESLGGWVGTVEVG
jgi:hypothetical protein